MVGVPANGAEGRFSNVRMEAEEANAPAADTPREHNTTAPPLKRDRSDILKEARAAKKRKAEECQEEENAAQQRPIMSAAEVRRSRACKLGHPG